MWRGGAVPQCRYFSCKNAAVVQWRNYSKGDAHRTEKSCACPALTLITKILCQFLKQQIKKKLLQVSLHVELDNLKIISNISMADQTSFTFIHIAL